MKKFRRLSQDKEHTPPPFHGTLSEFFTKVEHYDTKKTGIETTTFSSMESDAPLSISRSLDNVYIWNLNKISRDPNNHCPIVSLRMPSIKKTVICTGDAHDEVFGDIVQHVSNYKDLVRQYVDADAYTVVLMLPHHGSEGNTSFRMIKLFKPHVLGIAAGSGGQHGHPRTETIREYKQYYKTKKKLQKRIKNFWDIFSFKDTFYYLSFGDRIAKCHRLDAAKFLKPTRFPLLIICPNISGNICIQHDFTAQFHHQFTYDAQSYQIDFKKSLIDVKITDLRGVLTYNDAEYSQENGSIPLVFINKDKSSLIIRVDMKDTNKENVKVYYKGDKL